MGCVALQFGQHAQRIAPQVKQRQADARNNDDQAMRSRKHAVRGTRLAAEVWFNIAGSGFRRFWHVAVIVGVENGCQPPPSPPPSGWRPVVSGMSLSRHRVRGQARGLIPTADGVRGGLTAAFSFPNNRRWNIHAHFSIIARRARMQGNGQARGGFFYRHGERGFVDILNFR